MAARKAVTPAVVVTHASLNEARLAIQQVMPAFQRDSVNPHFNSSYLQLETLLPQVLEVLNANGVLLTQSPTFVLTPTGAVGGLRTELLHVASGESYADVMLLCAGESPQKQGSGITFAKRYALMAILGITADKDVDGNIGLTVVNPVQAPQLVPQPFVAGTEAQTAVAASPFAGAL
jgi:hypothetical protein